MTVTETGNIAMPLELSDLVAHNDGDEEEDQQLVSVCPIGGFLEYPLHFVAEQKPSVDTRNKILDSRYQVLGTGY